MKLVQVIAMVALTLSPATALQATSSGEKSADIQAIEKVLAGIIAADNAGDLDAVMSHYAEGAVLLPPNDIPVNGKAAIRTRYEAGFRTFRFDIKFAADETQSLGEWAFIRGAILGRIVPKLSEPSRNLNDKFIMVLRREKDGWKIVRLIWNSSDPAAKPAS